MFKAMILLKRKPSMNHADFANWWLQKHRPLAEQLPNLRRAVFNLSDPETAAQYDGVSELWFDNREDFEAAYASDTGQKVAADSLDNVGARERLFVTETILKD